MATTEAETSHDERPSTGGLVYDGFISYAHAADDLLAPRLQIGLQRFAKPWWKRRALRIFRDESSLSANPHLWSSITEALDDSGWFVLLLSPEAAESDWVNREVEYWLEERDPDRIIPVVTDGEFAWADEDLVSDAAPPALRGVFADEPRWVDLRFARTEEQLDLKNPRFSAAVADIASAIRGVPKDELESEEVRQHRRTVRTIWAAVTALLLLVLVAGGAAVYAIDQQNRANDLALQEASARQRADENAAAADEQRQIAEQNATDADTQRAAAEAAAADAEQQAEVAQARELVLAAEKVVDLDPELSAHLALTALASFRRADEPLGPAESALRAAIAADRIAVRLPGGNFVAVHPDGQLLATSAAEVGAAVVWDLEGKEVIERYGPGQAAAIGGSFSPDGNLLAIAFRDAESSVSIWNRTTGESFTLGTDSFKSSITEYLVFSPDAELLAFTTPTNGVEVWSVTERRLVYAGGKGSSGPDFNADGLLSYGWNPAVGETGASVRVIDPVSGRLVQTFPTDYFSLFFTAWSPDGTRIAAGDQEETLVLDAATGDEVVRTDLDRVSRPLWLPVGDAFVVGGESLPRVIDADTGEVRMELTGQAGGSWDYAIVPGTTLVASAGFVGSGELETAIFDTSQLGGVELGGWSAPNVINAWTVAYFGDRDRVVVADNEDSYVTADALDDAKAVFVQGGPTPLTPWFPVVSANGAFVASAAPDGQWVVRSSETGEVSYRAPEGWTIRGVSDDGRKVVIKEVTPDEFLSSLGPTRLVHTLDDSAVALDTPGPLWAYFSPDGEMVVLTPNDGDLGMGLYNAVSGDLIEATGIDTSYDGLNAAFAPDGSTLVVGGWTGTVYVYDVAALLSGASFEDAVVRSIPAHDSLVRSVSISPDGSKAATSARNDRLKVWDLETGRELGQFGGNLIGRLSNIGAFHPTLPHLLVTTPLSEVRIHTLDIDELVAIGRDGLSRPMTEEECKQHLHGSCPAP